MDLDILDNHIVICGWNDDIMDVIKTLLASTDRSILIVSENIVQQSGQSKNISTGGQSIEPTHSRKRAYSTCVF